MKKKKVKMNNVTICTTVTPLSKNNFYDECTSLAPCNYNPYFIPQEVPCQTDCVKQSIKGNNPMYVDNDKHIESSKVNYLTSRGENSFYSKMDGLSKLFGFGPFDSPDSIQEFIDRIVAGKFTIKDPSKKDTKNFYYRPMEGITWKDPSVKEDQVGYDAAKAALTSLWQDTKDTIAIGTPVEGLAAVKALDAWTPTA